MDSMLKLEFESGRGTRRDDTKVWFSVRSQCSPYAYPDYRGRQQLHEGTGWSSLSKSTRYCRL